MGITTSLKMPSSITWILSALLFTLPVWSVAQVDKVTFENLGKPVTTALEIDVVTQDKAMGTIAWAGLTDGSRSGLVGVRLSDGKSIYVDLLSYGKANSVLVFKASERYLYLFAGVKGRFFKYDIHNDRLETIGEPSNATYWMSTSYTQTPSGEIFVGTYPQAAVVALNPVTEQVRVIDRVSDSPGSQYVINPAADQGGMLYLPTGMHHGELWAYNPATNEKIQILPKALQTYGPPTVWKAADGNVYGRKGSAFFRCTPKKIIEQDVPEKEEVYADRTINGEVMLQIDSEGYLVVQNSNGQIQRKVRTDFELPAEEVYSVGDLVDGTLYGSSLKPGHMFTFNTVSGALTDLGKITRGGVQIYDILAYKGGLFASSYTGGYIDYFTQSPSGNLKRRPVAHLHRLAKQERAVQLVEGMDGKIYAPTIPIKGYLGGALVQIDPVTMKTKVFKPLPKQSLTSVTAIPETGMLFITASVSGGSSSTPVLKEAEVIIWDPAKEETVYRGKPITGGRRYGKTVRADNGIIYGSYRDSVYGFDPVLRKVVIKMQIPGRVKVSSQNVQISETIAPNGMVYIVDNVQGAIFTLDPVSNQIKHVATHPSLIGTRFSEVKEDGYLYYGHDSELWRARVLNKLK